MRHIISKLQVYNSKYSHPANQIIQLLGVSFVANSFWLMFRHNISLRQTFLEPKRFFYSGYQHVEFVLEFLLKWSSRYFSIRTENYNKWHDTSRDWTFLEHFIFFLIFLFKKSVSVASEATNILRTASWKREICPFWSKKKGRLLIFHIWVLSFCTPGNSFLGCMLFVEWQNLRDSQRAQPQLSSYLASSSWSTIRIWCLREEATEMCELSLPLRALSSIILPFLLSGVKALLKNEEKQ